MFAAAMTLLLLAAPADHADAGNNDTAYSEDSASSDSAGDVGCWWGPMPQTCYGPRYGCYPGNSRCIHRYPAFHGQYYRRPYNYRNLFDYPWHAQLHEPTSMFSYDVPAPEEGQSSQDAAPHPLKDKQSAARRDMRSVMKRPQMVDVSAPR